MGSTVEPANNQNNAPAENMAVDQVPVPNGENHATAKNHVEVSDENVQNVEARNKNVIEIGSEERLKFVLASPSVKSIVVGGPIMMNLPKSLALPSGSKSPL